MYSSMVVDSPVSNGLQPLKRTDSEINDIAQLVIDNYDDDEARASFIALTLQLYVIALLY